MLKNHSPQIFWGFATKGVTFALFYAVQILLVRRLGLHDYGLWSVFYSVFSVAMIFSCFGLNHSSRKYIAEHDKAAVLPDILRSALKLRFWASLFFALLWLALSGPLSAALGRPELGPLLRLSAPLLFLCGYVEQFKEFFIGLRRIDFNCALNAAEYSGKIVFLLLFFAAAATPERALGGFTAGCALSVLCGLWLLRHYMGTGTGEDFSRALGFYAAPLLASELFTALLSELDTIVLGVCRPPEEVGLYSVAKQVMFKAPHLALALGMGVLPVFASRDGGLAALRPLFDRLLRVNGLLSSALAALLVLLGGPVLSLLFGAESRAAAAYFPWLLPYLFASTFNVYFSYLLEYRGRAGLIARHLAVSLAVSAALLVLLAPGMGAKGAALAVSCGYVLLAWLNWRAARKLFV
ncbi:MAG: oligosaccharide flippase family protein [Elusimicrobia bacterium]|nr:oligosaccharide flippase family protein [Elusimicrobiota bacterium]